MFKFNLTTIMTTKLIIDTVFAFTKKGAIKKFTRKKYIANKGNVVRAKGIYIKQLFGL